MLVLASCADPSPGVPGIGEEGVTSPPPAASSSPTTPERATGSLPGLAPRVAIDTAKPFRQTCRPGVFCDDFELDLTKGGWAKVVGAGASLGLAGPSASPGLWSVEVGGAGGAAYLRREAATIGALWAGGLGFSVRADTLPAADVAGPALVFARQSGTSTLHIALGPAGLTLVQSCSNGCTARQDVVVPLAAATWQRIYFGVESSSTAPEGTYGRAEIVIDNQLFAYPLVVPIDHAALDLRVGVTAGGSAVPIRFDDVLFMGL